MEQGIRIRTVAMLWLLLLGITSSYAQDYSTRGEIFDYEVGDIFHFRNEAGTTHWTGYIKLFIIEITAKDYSTNNDTVFYERWIETAYIDSGNPEWVFDSYSDTINYTDLDSLFNADSVYFSNNYNGRKVSYIEVVNQHPYYKWLKYVDGCGRALYFYEYAVPYPYWGYWEEKALNYFKKGDEEWGTPLTIVDIDEQVSVVQGFIAYPNPFTTSTTIEFALDAKSKIQISIFNTIGEEVFHKEDHLDQGTHHFSWSPHHLPAGLYYGVLRSEEWVSVIKMIKQ